MERYIIVERYADNGELSHRALVDSADGRELGTDGGEPEDQSFWRDWAWVPDELNRQQATIAALEQRIQELQDKVGECAKVPVTFDPYW